MSSVALTPAATPARFTRSAALTDRALWAVGALTVLGAALRFSGLGTQSYWFDESVTVVLTHLSVGHLLTAVPNTETTPPLYYVLAWAWIHLWGTGPVALRSVSAIAGTLVIPVVALTAHRLSGPRAAVFAGALTACNPLLVWYAQEARAYSMLVLFCSVTLWCCAQLTDDASPRWTRRWALAATAALWTHYFALIIVMPQAVWLLARHRHRRPVRLAVAAVVAGAVPLLPLAVKQITDLESAGDWLKLIPLAHRIGDVPRTFVTGPQTIWGGWQLALAGVTVLAGAWCGVRRASASERRTIGLCAGCVGAGVMLVGAALVGGHDELDYRNMLVLLPPAALALACALGARRAGRVGTVAAAALCISGFGAATAVKFDQRLQRPDWHGLAATLGARPGRAILIRRGCQWLPLSLYMPGLHPVPATGRPFTEVDVVTPAGGSNWTDVLETDWYIQCSPTPRTDRPAASIPGFTRVGAAQHLGAFSVQRFRSPRPAALSPAATARLGLAGELLTTR